MATIVPGHDDVALAIDHLGILSALVLMIPRHAPSDAHIASPLTIHGGPIAHPIVMSAHLASATDATVAQIVRVGSIGASGSPSPVVLLLHGVGVGAIQVLCCHRVGLGGGELGEDLTCVVL